MKTTALSIAAGLGLAAALLAGCSDQASGAADGGGGDGGGLTITQPADGATVDTSVDVAWESDVELGEPETGRDHVHVFVDGDSADYTVVGGNEFTIEGLSPGEHTINVTLQHADHSSAGEEDEVDVTVDPGAAPSESEQPQEEADESQQPDSGYGY